MGLPPSPCGEKSLVMSGTAKRAALVTIVVIAIAATALALWVLKALIALLLFGFVIAAAMRPGVERLEKRGIPRVVGISIHYVVIAGAIALFLWLVVPRAVDQLSEAIGNVPTSTAELGRQAKESSGIKHDILVAVQKRLERLPSGAGVVHPAITIGKAAFEALLGTFFVFATAAYWIFERDRAIDLVVSLAPRQKRRVVRDTWLLIDLKLGAFVRGQLLLVAFVATVLSVAFWAIGLPYWLLVGIFAGIVEVVPIIGPLIAGLVAVGVALPVSWHLALWAALIVLGVRLLEDYIVVPRVLGHAVGLSPLVVLVAVTGLGVLLGPIYVLLAVPVAAVVVTLVDVFVRDRDPAKEDVPAVLFPAQDAETAAGS
jgi:predicted PurR-regulated permease PerM